MKLFLKKLLFFTFLIAEKCSFVC